MTTTELVIEQDGIVLRGTGVGSGPTVLLLHAGGERRSVWAPVAALLAQAGLRAVAYDLRGHGESGGEASTLAVHAADVAAMVLQQPPPVALVGCSLGGLAAVAALADAEVARRVDRLVLVDVVPDPDPPRARAWLAAQALVEGRAALIDDILARGPDLLATLAAVTMPILLVRAGTDSPMTDEDAARLLAAQPAVRIASVPQAGHLVARDAPADLARILVDDAVAATPADPAGRAALALQRDLGAATVAHPGGSLLAHLERVHAQVRWWGAGTRARLAAVSHATYGTDGFPHALLPPSDRARLATTIGPEAESLVHLYGGCDRARTYARLGADPLPVTRRWDGGAVELAGDDLVDFAVLTIANELDVARFASLPTPAVAELRALIGALAAYAPAEAADALGDPALA